jgi:hypothetical protein
MIPAQHRIDKVMQETGMGELQAIRHLQQRDQLRREDFGGMDRRGPRGWQR